MLTAYTDGACRISNPGLCSCAWVVYSGEDELISYREYLGPELHTNNYAEYMGLIRLLEYLHKTGKRNVKIHCDSKLVVEQVNLRWNCTNQHLDKLRTDAYWMLVHGAHMLVHIDGHSGVEGNERADRLCNEELDTHMEEYYFNKARTHGKESQCDETQPA